MIYYLDRDQFQSFWFGDDDNPPDNVCTSDSRTRLWLIHFKEKFNLNYFENSQPHEPAYFGAIEGDEKFINWFLMLL